MKRPLGLSDPRSATATVVFAPSATDIGAASESRAVLTRPGCTEFTLIFGVLEFHCQMNREHESRRHERKDAHSAVTERIGEISDVIFSKVYALNARYIS
jgi:hypothetical protein